jgi:hypothetical protein
MFNQYTDTSEVKVPRPQRLSIESILSDSGIMTNSFDSIDSVGDSWYKENN